MFSLRTVVSYIAIATFVTGALASPTPTESQNNYCNVGQAQCCKQVTKSDDKSIQSLIGLLGIASSIGDTLVGVQCSPIVNVVGIGSGCKANPVCCSGNNYNGLINVGCTSISL
ncbi:fungal hydrophobin [Serendipita vermifera]|nr:fungal hydrophobin [Serendipita vermifera]